MPIHIHTRTHPHQYHMSLSSKSAIWTPLQLFCCLPHPGIAFEIVINWRFSSNCTTFSRFLQHIFTNILIQHIAPYSVKYSEADLQVLLQQVSFCEVFFMPCPLGRRPEKSAYFLILMAVVAETHRAIVKTNI